MRKLLPRVARLGHVLYFSVNLQAPFKFGAKMREILPHFTSLGLDSWERSLFERWRTFSFRTFFFVCCALMNAVWQASHRSRTVRPSIRKYTSLQRAAYWPMSRSMVQAQVHQHDPQGQRASNRWVSWRVGTEVRRNLQNHSQDRAGAYRHYCLCRMPSMRCIAC